MKRFVAALAYACLTVFTAAFPLPATAAIDSETVRALAFGESDDKLKAIGALTSSGDTEALTLLQALRDGEVQTVGEDQALRVKELLSLTRASVLLASKDKSARLAAIRALADSNHPATRTLLLGVLERHGEAFAEPDASVRAEAEKSLRAVESKLATGEMIGRI